MIRDALKTILTCRRELTILRREVDRLRYERDEAQKDAAHLDQLVQQLRRDVSDLLNDGALEAMIADRDQSRRDFIHFRARTLAALEMPSDATIEDVEEEINPSGWPADWDETKDGIGRRIQKSGDYVYVATFYNYADVDGPMRDDRDALRRDAHALAATLARRLRQEPA
jgi:hypothetical protein